MSYTVELTNNCPGRIWYRVKNGDSFVGNDIDGGGSRAMQTISSETQYETVAGFAWEKGDEEVWAPTFNSPLDKDAYTHRISITPIFGPRPASSIKVFMACMAGPADPSTRNDITLIETFIKAGVPREYIWMFLERQATKGTISECLPTCVDVCDPDDILFVYLGGHGSGPSDEYHLCTWGGGTGSSIVLSAIQQCKCPVFMVVDSCYAGQMIEDAKAMDNLPPLTICASVQRDSPASTGWRLIQYLIDHVSSGDYVTPMQISSYIVENLRTPNPNQRAQCWTNIQLY